MRCHLSNHYSTTILKKKSENQEKLKIKHKMKRILKNEKDLHISIVMDNVVNIVGKTINLKKNLRFMTFFWKFKAFRIVRFKNKFPGCLESPSLLSFLYRNTFLNRVNWLNMISVPTSSCRSLFFQNIVGLRSKHLCTISLKT